MTGAGQLAALAIRRDRLMLVVWVYALTAIAASGAYALRALYPTAAGRARTAGADGLRGLPVTQVFHELHDADERELPGMERGLTLDGVHIGEQLIVKECAHLIT